MKTWENMAYDFRVPILKTHLEYLESVAPGDGK